MKKAFAFASLLFLPLSTELLSAQTIYDDSFARGSVAQPVILQGTSPDVVNTGNAQWGNSGSSSDWETNGLAAADPSTTPYLTPELPFTASLLPASPTGILTLSADVTATSTGDATNWTTLGFFYSNPPPFYNPSANTTGAGEYTLLLRANGELDSFTTGSNDEEILIAGSAAMTSTTAMPLSEQFNFSAGIITISVDGLPVGTRPFDASDAAAFLSSVKAVGFSGLSDSASIGDFVVSYSVPEPSAYALLGLGFAALVVAARVRRPAVF